MRPFRQGPLLVGLLAPALMGWQVRAQWVLMVGELKKMLPAQLGRVMLKHQSIAFVEPEPMMRVAGRLESVMPQRQSTSFAERELVMWCFQQVFPEMSRRVQVPSWVE